MQFTARRQGRGQGASQGTKDNAVRYRMQGATGQGSDAGKCLQCIAGNRQQQRVRLANVFLHQGEQ